MKYLFLILCCVSLSGCQRLYNCSDDNLSIELEEYTGDQLQNQGYFFKEIENSTEESLTEVFFLFNNGIVLGSDGYDYISVSENTIDVNQTDTALKSKAAWGVFTISESSIEIEHWRSTSIGCFKTKYLKGKVLTETSFLITSIELREKGKVTRLEDVNDLYVFRILEEMPNSNNEYIP